MKRGFTLTLLFTISTLTCLGQYKMSTDVYVDKYKDLAIQQMKLYGIPASITLAQGLLESGNGGSRLATQANNHFGIKCKSTWTGPKIYHDDDSKGECFRKYHTVEESYRDHSLFLKGSSRYAALFELKITDYKGWAHGLKEAGYATNPKYATLLINLIENNNLYQFDRHSGNSGDSGKIQGVNLKNEGIARRPDRNGRQWGYNNGVRYIVARKGDTFETIIRESGLSMDKILKYNDLIHPIDLSDGLAFYTHKKKNSSALTSVHTVARGETTHSISQKYAITIKALHRMNPTLKRSSPMVGQRLRLR